MSKEGIVCLLMILNVNTYASVILERSLRANGHIGVNESMLTIMKQIWTQMNGYFLYSKRCKHINITCQAQPVHLLLACYWVHNTVLF